MNAVLQQPVQTRKQRTRQVRAALVEHGFVQQRLRLHGVASAGTTESLMEVLNSLGSVFSAFGRYLATRIELLDERDAELLSDCQQTPDSAVISNFANAATLSQLQTQLLEIDPSPVQVSWLSQRHRGKTRDGGAVEVKVVRTLSVQEQADLELLSLLAPAVKPLLKHANRFESLVVRFRKYVADRTDCTRFVEWFDALFHDAAGNSALRIPKVYPELSGDSFVVLEHIGGQRLNELPASNQWSSRGLIPDEVGRTLCEAWLEQTLNGSLMPVDFTAPNIVVVSNTEVALIDGTFAVLPNDAKKNLQNYLLGVISNDPGSALDHIIREFDPSLRTASDSELARLFRQAVASPDSLNDADRIATKVAIHWITIEALGFQAYSHMAHAIRAIGNLSRTAGRVAPARDSLNDGLHNLRSTQMARELTALIDPGRWGGELDRIASLMMFGPQRVDGALNSVSDESRIPTPQTNRHTVSTHTLIILALFALVVFKVDTSGILTGLSQLGEPLQAIGFLLIGGLVLRHITHERND